MPVQYEQVAQFFHDPGYLCAIIEPPFVFCESIVAFQDHYTSKVKKCQVLHTALFIDILNRRLRVEELIEIQITLPIVIEVPSRRFLCLQFSKYLLQPSSKVSNVPLDIFSFFIENPPFL
jgi:hypothetical protein